MKVRYLRECVVCVCERGGFERVRVCVRERGVCVRECGVCESEIFERVWCVYESARGVCEKVEGTLVRAEYV